MRWITLPNGLRALQGADALGGTFSVVEDVSAEGLQGLLAKIKAHSKAEERSQPALPVNVEPYQS
jgi:hypothetical protein